MFAATSDNVLTRAGWPLGVRLGTGHGQCGKDRLPLMASMKIATFVVPA
jgi:hypothetical protein